MNNQIEAYLKAIQFKITGGSDFQWKCYGDNARYLDSELLESDRLTVSSSMIFDTNSHIVYEITVSSDSDDEDIAYRWINPDFKEKHKEEAISRSIDHTKAWEDKTWGDTDCFDDIINKITAIYNGEKFDTRVVLTLDVDDDTFMMIARAAHLEDITFNHFVEKALRAVVEKEKELNSTVDSNT